MATPDQRLSSATVAAVAIASIVIGVRRRTRIGRLQSLQRSIEKHGLIHPILLRNGNELVAGHRRLEACRQLGWRAIPARHVERMSDEELRAIEVDENRERDALNDFDTSKARLAEIRQAEAELKAKAATEFRSPEKRNSRRGRNGEGRPPKAGSKRHVAEATGIAPTTQVKIEKHVAIAEQYPFLQRAGWVQHAVLEAGAVLDELPAPDRSKIAALLDQDAIPAKRAIAIIRNMATMPAVERRAVFALAASSDEFDRRTALTKAAAVPPPVDPGLTRLGNATTELRLAATSCRAAEFKPQLEQLSQQASHLLGAFEEWNHAQRR